jgi:hypothetical protein
MSKIRITPFTKTLRAMHSHQTSVSKVIFVPLTRITNWSSLFQHSNPSGNKSLLFQFGPKTSKAKLSSLRLKLKIRPQSNLRGTLKTILFLKTDQKIKQMNKRQNLKTKRLYSKLKMTTCLKMQVTRLFHRC